MSGSSASVEERLGRLLQVADFPPPASCTARAQVRDPAVYRQATAPGRNE